MSDDAAAAAGSTTSTSSANADTNAGAGGNPTATLAQNYATPAPTTDAGDNANKDSGGSDKAQDQDKSGTDEPKPGDQSSKVDDQKTDGADDADDKASDDDKAADDADKSDGDDKDADDGKDGDDGEDKEGEDSATYEQFTLPEGMEMDEELMEEFTPLLKAHDVPQEEAQKFVDLAVKMQQKVVSQMTKQHEQKVQSWHDQTVAKYGDKGEEDFNEKTAIAQKAINKFFPEEERNILTQYGVGNLPGLFGLAYQVGIAISEDSSDMPSTSGGDGGDQSLGQIWYPDAKQK